MEPIDIREQNDPARDASRPYGQASADENALRSLASIGGGSAAAPLDIHERAARGRKQAPPVALPPLVNPGAVVPRRSSFDETGAEVGGLGRQYPFMASNELSQKALLNFPAAVQRAFANRKIDRPAMLPQDVYGSGKPETAGGYYDPESKGIVLARGNADAYGDPNVDVGGAQHEILHAISYEGQGFSQDRQAGYAELKAALTQAMPTLMANPSTTKAASDAQDALDKNDPDHAFTAIGDLYIKGVPLPHALQAYFDQMQSYRSTPSTFDLGAAAAPTERGVGASAPATPAAPTPTRDEMLRRGLGFEDLVAASDKRSADSWQAAGRWFHSGAAAAEQGWNDIVQGFGPAMQVLGAAQAAQYGDLAQVTHPPETWPTDDKGKPLDAWAVLRPVGGVVGILGSPFTATAETIRVSTVQNIPELNAVYEQALADAPKTTLTDPAAIERERATNEAAAAQVAINAGRTTLYNGAKDENLPFGTRVAALTVAGLLGAETAGEFGVPSMIYRIPAAFRMISRWGLFNALRAADEAPASEAVQLRLAALDKAKADVAAQERAASAALGVGEEQGPLAAKVAGGQSLLRVSKAEAVGEQAKANAKIASTNQTSTNALLKQGIAAREAAIPAAARRNLGDIINERVRINALRSEHLGEAVPSITPEDERAILSGIHAAAEEIAPQIEARTQNLGELLTNAAKNSEKQMFNALRRAMTEGETFSMRNVTVGEDAEGKATRLRQMVGTFDQAIESIRNTAAGAGRERQGEELLAPFLEARRGAMEALQAQDAYNAALKRNVSLAVSDYRTASKAATQARLAEDRAYAATTRTGQKVAKAEASVGTQADKQAQRTETTVDTLQTRVDKAKADALAASQSVKLRVGGDTAPQIAHVGTGYVAPDVSEVWARNRLHTGTFDDPLVGEAMAQWVREHPGQVDEAEHSWQQFTSSISSLTGADISAVQRAIPKTGETTRTMYVAEQVFGQLIKEWRATGQAVRDGVAPESALLDKTARVMAFEDALRKGIGEQGRALAARNLVKKADAVQVLAANERVRTSYAVVERLAKQIDNLEGRVAEATAAKDGPLLVRARASLEQALTEFDGAKSALDEARTASSAAADEVYKMALRKAVAQGASKDTAAILAKFDPGDIVPIAAFLRSLKPQGLGALAMRLASAGRYGKVPSQIQNFVGNNAFALFQEALVRPTQILTGPVASRISGVEAKMTPKAVGAAWLGISSNVPDAGRFLARSLWQGKADDIALKHGIADFETLIGQGLESGTPVFRIGGHTFELTGPKAIPVDVTLRALYAADGFQRILYEGADRRALLALKGFSGGVKGAVQAVAEDLTLGEREWIRSEGLIKSFNEPIRPDRGGNPVERLEKAFMGVLGAVDIGGFQPLRLMIPAARFGMRNVETGLRISGAGLLTGTRLAIRARNTELTGEARTLLARQAMREMAEGAVGAGLLVYGFHLAADGITTGALPTDPKERARWAALGIQPMSFHVGDKYVPFGWFGPLAAPFALSALIHDGASDQTDDALGDRVARAAAGIGQYAMDQPAFYAMKNLVDAISNGVTQQNWEGMNTILSQIATATSMGALAQSMTAVFDPYQRDPEGLLQRIFARYPGISETVPPKIDPKTGQPLARPQTGPGALIGTDIGTDKAQTTVGQEAESTVIGALSKTFTSGTAKVQLTQDQFKAYEANARQKGQAAAAKVIATDAYTSNTDPVARQAMLKAAYDKAAGEARVDLATTLVAAARTPDDVFNAAVVSRTALPEFRYVLMVGSLVGDGRLTTDVAKRLDDSRAAHPDGTRDPLVADLRAAAPLVRQYVAIKPRLRGDSTEWRLVQDQRAEMAAIKAAKGDAAAAAYAKSHPLITVYANGAMDNPARAAFLDAHKSIKTLVGGSDWEWVK